MENLEDLDSNVATYVKEKGDIESAVEKLHDVITHTATNLLKFEGPQIK